LSDGIRRNNPDITSQRMISSERSLDLCGALIHVDDDSVVKWQRCDEVAKWLIRRVFAIETSYTCLAAAALWMFDAQDPRVFVSLM
jgi:hypothetical protein